MDANGYDANDPKHLLEMRAVVAEDDGEDDAAQISDPARGSTHDAVGVRVHVRHERENGAVAGFEEEGHAGDEPEHRALVVAVGKTDGDLEGAGDNGEAVNEELLAPHAGSGVNGIGDRPAHGPEDNVQ